MNRKISRKLTMKRSRTGLGIAGLILVSGCSLAPDYQRPVSPVPDAYPGETKTSESDKSAADIHWRDVYADVQLQKVIELALTNNRDLREAVLNIEAARAAYRIQRADLFPGISANAGSAAERTAASLSQTGSSVTSHQYSADIGFTSYELDLFGRVRSLNEQALQSFYGTRAARRSAQISLVAEVAHAWLTLAADRQRLRLAIDTFDSRRESLALIQQQYELGEASRLALSQAKGEVERARADVASYRMEAAQDRNALVLLAGAPVPEWLLPDRLGDSLQAVPELPAGLPSQLLERRPDVIQAETELKAANANIGAARAAFFPRIALTGSLGNASSSLDGLFESGSSAWNFGSSISLPLFDAGSNRANLSSAEVSRDIRVVQYEKAIRSAFREVADALAAREELGKQLAAQASLVETNALSLELSEARFRNGMDDYLEVLDAQRSLYSAQQSLITAQLSRLANSATLYKALGGGWQPTDSPLPQPKA